MTHILNAKSLFRNTLVANIAAYKPDTKVSSGSGGTIGPLYKRIPSGFLVMNSKLRCELSHISRGGYQAQPFPRKLLEVC